MIVQKNIKQMLAEDGFCVTGFSGVSMWPMLHADTDRLLIVKPEFPLKKDDIALYVRGDQFVLHRVLDQKDDIYIIRGDNCIGLEYIPQEKIIGVLSGFWRGETFFDCTGAYSLKYARRAEKTLPYRVLRGKAARIKHKIFG